MPARYRKLRKIADGGMAEIFLATQHGAEGFERRVVLKQILAPLLADPKFKHMIVDEADERAAPGQQVRGHGRHSQPAQGRLHSD
jgi:hypothetical protein